MAQAKANSKAKVNGQWPAKASDPPALSDMDWNKVMLLGVVFIVMAVLQIVSFNDFETILTNMGLSSPATWAGVLIFAELVAGFSMFKVRMSSLFRMFGATLAALASGFWFFETIRLVANDLSGVVSNVGYFGRFLSQAPGWWTVIESTVVLAWTLWVVRVTAEK